MTPEQVAAFVLFAVAAAGTPGPSNALLAATGARVGLARGLPALFGVAAGLGTLMFAVTLGLGAAILGNPAVATAARWCGAAFLFWLAWRIATSDHAGGAAGRPIGFLGAAAFQWINPKAWLVCASAAATFLDRAAGGAVGQSASLALLFLLASLPSGFPWLAFGAVLQRQLCSARAARRLNVVMGALLAASVVMIVR